MGGFMKTKQLKLCRNRVPAASLLALAAPLALLCSGMMVETAKAQSAEVRSDSSQTPRVPARITQVVDERSLVTLRGNVHRLARAEFDRGAVEDSQPANRMVLLLKRSDDQEAALRQLLDDQQSKASPNYHAWLTPDQFGKQFGPADEDLQTVTDWLTSRGFTGIKVGAGRTTIEFSGNIGQVRNAFHTEIHHFLVNGEAHMANISDPQIPHALSPVVAGVLSLNNFRHKAQSHPIGTFRRTKATGEVKPLFTFAGCGSTPCYALGPGDFRTIYNVPYVPSTMDGTGVTIAIVQDSNVNVADIQAYRSIFGLPANFTSSNIILNGPDPGIQGPDTLTGDEIEADLDLELSGGVAPGATIDLVVSENSQSIGVLGTDLSAAYIIDNNLAPVMSESFSACETLITAAGEGFYDLVWEQASAQGITVIVSAGDSGSDSCDQGNGDFSTSGLSVNGIASTPFNVAIGGTDFQNGANPSPFWNTTNAASTQVSAKGYVPESTWNDGCASTAKLGSLGTCTAVIVNGNAQTQNDLVGGGGGPSALTSGTPATPVNAKPSWQTGTPGNPADTFRDVPDISFFAGDGRNNSFYIICQTDANAANGGSATSCDLNSPFADFLGVGGTSAGAPAFAGIMALVNQKLGRQGNANYVLYRVYKKNTAGTICTSAASPASTCIFYDTVTGNNSVACQGGTTNCSNTTSGSNQYGVLVDPNHTNTPAWVTTANYDLATGLGSLNAANLINAWDAGAADTVAITAPASGTVNITHGVAQSFTVKVTQGSGTTVPSGDVSLVAKPTGKPQVGIGAFSDNGPFTLTSGSVTFSTALLPGGTSYPVVASYAGDGTFAPGTSAPVNVTVAPEASQTTVSAVTFDSSGNPTVHPGAISVAYGSGYILQMLVADSKGNQCNGSAITCPTGTVTLKDNGAGLSDFSGSSTASLNSIGVAEDQFVQLPVGANSLVATYSGDNSYNTSTSAATVVTITKAPTSISLASSANAVSIGQNVTLTATIGTQSVGVGPTGTVTFSAGGTTLGTATIVPANASAQNAANFTAASGTATLTKSFSTAGVQSITATYTAGDANYSGSGPSTPPITLTVAAGGQATTTTLTPTVTSLPPGGGSVTLTATIAGTNNGGVAPTGTVTFKVTGASAPLAPAVTCATPTLGTSTTPGTCTATLPTTLTTTGANTITAAYSGDTIYAVSTGQTTVTVAAKQATTTVVTPSATSIASGGSETLTATVTVTTSNGAPPSGTVQFMNGTAALGAAAKCTAGSSTTTCTAMLATTLSLLTPPPIPRQTPNFPATPMWIVACLTLIAFLLSLKRLPAAKRLGYACAGMLLFACVAAGIAGCGGGSSGGGGGGGTPHTDSITAVYSGDANYTGSTSTAVPITVQ
jgi:hypothetical protein